MQEREFEVWMEGFAATGESATAQLLGKYKGKTFMDAYLNYVKEKYGNSPPDYVDLTKPVIWGCNCYSTEIEARKYFG